MARWDSTHEKLQQAALELFAERGYQTTGTAEIARRAGVSEMTLFRHFPSKDALLFADPFDPLMADAVRKRPADETAMRALTEGIRQTWLRVAPAEADALRHQLRIIAETPGLNGAIERNSEATVTALVDALTDRGITRLRARVVTTAVIAGLSTALLEWARSEGAALDRSVGAALDVLAGE